VPQWKLAKLKQKRWINQDPEGMMELKGKKVLVVGLGKSGLAAALFLRQRGRAGDGLRHAQRRGAGQGDSRAARAGIMVESGGHGLLTFRRQDLIVVSPGVPLDTPELVQARFRPAGHRRTGAGRAVSQGQSILAITGSNGKTTTTALTARFLPRRAFETQVGGNIGVPVVDLIAKARMRPGRCSRFRAFSWRARELFHPKIAVILNITPDHLDRHGSFENYALAKERIFARRPGRFLVLNADNARAAEAAAKLLRKVYWFSREEPVRRAPGSERARGFSRSAGAQSSRSCRSEPFRSRARTTLRMCWRRCARRGWRAPRRAIARPSSFRAVEHRLELSRRSTASSTTTTPRPPMWMPRPRPSRRFPGHSSDPGRQGQELRLRRSLRSAAQAVKAVYTIGSAAAKIESQTARMVPIVPARRWTRQ
jgi:UDP-N-acetylmuramoylalanine--D-glutamate ligase